MSTDALATIARQRAVLSTIADVIVAAAHGKSLRVAVHYDHGGGEAFADRLTQALLARGRDCHCPPTAHGSAPVADDPGIEGQASARRTVMISGGPADPDGTDTCRIDVQVDATTRPGGPSSVEDGADPERRDSGGYDLRQPDVVVDYRHPDGPTIRHVASWLARASA